MLYTQASTGYKSGGFNSRPFNLEQLVGYGPEEVVAYEAGIKSQFFDRKLTLNLTGFYNDYDGRVVTVQGVDSNGLPFSRPANVGTAVIKGLEVEAEARPIDGMLLDASLGYINFKSPQLPGLKPSGVPDWTASAGIQQRISVGDSVGTLTPRLDWTYRSRVFFDAQNNPLAATPGRSIFNGRITWEHPDSDWSASLSVSNIGNKLYYINKFTKIALGQGIVEGQPARQREWALTVKRRF
jgi:iron complex outermembrane receptor protein